MNFLTLSAGESLDAFFKSFDMFFFNFFGGIQNNILTPIMKFFTLFGDARVIIAVMAAGIIMCLFKKTRKIGLCVFISLIFGIVVTNVILKPCIARPRPYITLQNDAQFMEYYLGAGALRESDYSFPSGHTTASFSYCTALYLSFRKSHKYIAVVFPIIAFLVMVSRVYLMVHYASDVIFGMLTGIVGAVVSFLLSDKICRTKFGSFSIGKAAGKSI